MRRDQFDSLCLLSRSPPVNSRFLLGGIGRFINSGHFMDSLWNGSAKVTEKNVPQLVVHCLYHLFDSLIRTDTYFGDAAL
jgi:hypothetical protein